MADIGDNDCRQDAATNEHEIMNKTHYAAGLSAKGLCERSESIDRYGESVVGAALNTQADGKDALDLRDGAT